MFQYLRPFCALLAFLVLLSLFLLLTDLIALPLSIWQSDQSESNQTRFMQEANQKNREKPFIQHKVYAPIASGHVDVSQIIL